MQSRVPTVQQHCNVLISRHFQRYSHGPARCNMRLRRHYRQDFDIRVGTLNTSLVSDAHILT